MRDRINEIHTSNIISAPNGYANITPCWADDDDETTFWIRPIIALAITHWHNPTTGESYATVDAITLDGVIPPMGDGSYPAILKPDGSVEIPCEHDFKSQEEYLRYVNEGRAKKAK